MKKFFKEKGLKTLLLVTTIVLLTTGHIPEGTATGAASAIS